MELSRIARDEAHFQQAPTAEQIQAMCAAAGIVPERAREVGGGYFNSTFVVTTAEGRQVILRVAPAPGAHVYPNERSLMRREYSVQPYLAPIAPLLPKVIMADFTHQVVNRDYVFQSFIEGEVWSVVRDSLTPEELDAIRRQLGAIARRVNDVVGTGFGFPAPEPAFATWSEALLDFLGGMRDELVRLGFPNEAATTLLQWLEANRALFDEIREPRLMHGDLWPANVLIKRTDSGPVITGILDSERAMWGDPLFEWIYNLGGQQPAYWEGYGERQVHPVRELAYRGIWLVLVIMECHRVKQDPNRPYTDLCEVVDRLQKGWQS